jgi:hypothetical protein
MTAGIMTSRRRVHTRVAPSPRGRKVIAWAAAYRSIWAGIPCALDHSQRKALDRGFKRANAIEAKIERVADEVAMRPVRTIADMVDAAILAVWADESEGGQCASMLAGVLELAGLTADACSRGDWSTADWRKPAAVAA